VGTGSRSLRHGCTAGGVTVWLGRVPID